MRCAAMELRMLHSANWLYGHRLFAGKKGDISCFSSQRDRKSVAVIPVTVKCVVIVIVQKWEKPLTFSGFNCFSRTCFILGMRKGSFFRSFQWDIKPMILARRNRQLANETPFKFLTAMHFTSCQAPSIPRIAHI